MSTDSRPWQTIYEAQARDSAYADFVARFPAYAATARLDDLRAADYRRLDDLGHAYLDYTGGGLYASSQLRRHHELLESGVYGNPHSHNPTSLASTKNVEAAREAVRRFFRAAEDEYEVVFTANASAALKLAGESYPFRPGSAYVLSYDNHNSVNGIREFAHRKGAAIHYVPVRREDLRVDEDMLFEALHRFGTPGSAEAAGAEADKLFAFPAQSNFSGVQHPLEWVARAQELGWDVVLDCAAFVPTNRLDLSVVKPDFVPISFYKMFGYPTGVGALLARRDKLVKLRRPWFAGGTITLASVQEERWYHLAPGAAGFEDGTLDYLDLPAVTIGLEHVAAVGIESIHERVRALAGWVLEEFAALRHSDGAPLIKVFGPPEMDRRGSTIAFYLLDGDGRPYDVYDVEAAAGTQLISLRSGCFCNPGDGEVAHGITHDDMKQCFEQIDREAVNLKHCQLMIQDATGKVPNTLRVSLGIVSDFADVYRLLGFCAGYRDRAGD
jgi:molybdenum cofactor sulfurtransferase